MNPKRNPKKSPVIARPSFVTRTLKIRSLLFREVCCDVLDLTSESFRLKIPAM